MSRLAPLVSVPALSTWGPFPFPSSAKERSQVAHIPCVALPSFFPFPPPAVLLLPLLPSCLAALLTAFDEPSLPL